MPIEIYGTIIVTPEESEALIDDKLKNLRAQILKAQAEARVKSDA